MCWILTVLLVVTIAAGAAGFGVLYKHQKEQDEKIEYLIGITDKSEVAYEDDAFNYLAIGNSLTKHPLCNYWWNECGMAASTADKDYYHQIVAYLESAYGKVVSEATNGASWETQATDRQETLVAFDNYLSPKLNLVTIQFGENAQDLTTYEEDFEELIQYVKDHAPNADIVVIGDYWVNGNRDELKKTAAENCGVSYVSLKEIQNKEEYNAGMDTKVYDADGGEHKIWHGGVAAHPGDKGMEYIAQATIEAIKKLQPKD